MKILRDDAIAICMALGYATATKWKKDRMNRKMKEIAEMDSDGLELEDESIDDPKELKRLNGILKAMVKAEEIEVVLEDDGADGSDDGDDDGGNQEKGKEDDGDGTFVPDDPESNTDKEEAPKPVKPKKGKKVKAKAKPKQESKVTKKSVVIQMLQRKGGATLEEMGEAITEAGVDADTEKNTKTAGLWIRKIGFEVELNKDSKKYQAKK